MNDLHDRLAEIAGPAVPPSTAVIDADLLRGRRALRRRRAGQAVAGSAFAAAAIAAAVSLGMGGPTAVAPDAGPPIAAGPTTVAATQLVAYQGEQPVGYRLDKVPAGWEIQGADQSVLTLAPVDAPDQDPNSFVGKIAVMQQHDKPTGLTEIEVEVAGKPGVVAEMLGDTGTRTLFVKQPSELYLTVQIWEGLGWDTGDIVEFAAGIHIDKDAKPTVG